MEPRMLKSDTVSSFSSSICHGVIGLVALILVFCQLFLSPLSASSRDSSSSSLSAMEWYHMHLWSCYFSWHLSSSQYSPSLAFCMYSAYKLNKQGDNILPCRTAVPILNQNIVPWLVLTITSWPAYRFLWRLVGWFGFFKNFHSFFKIIHIVKGFSLAIEAEVDVFSGTPLLSPWSYKCWQFDLWFLCLLKPSSPSISSLFT